MNFENKEFIKIVKIKEFVYINREKSFKIKMSYNAG